MSFAKVVTLAMVTAFSAGAGYSYLAEKHGLPMPGVAMSHETVSNFEIETVSPSVQLIKTAPLTSKVQPSDFKPYVLCSGSTRHHCVVDGDTLWHEGTKIRVADIDTPEVSEPKCSSEATLGARATRRLLQLVNQGPVEFVMWDNRDEDKYGRKLRVLIYDGRSLGDVLVSEGLARTWTDRRQPWC
ncbi:thermonuclease family protein [Shinella zoogloeoides]|uniref:thermonuclease family protein n=1 Tax=Shinella zoogloeoides TaxID=352475 RepID=UPI0028A5A9A3|nr:thermonuclease family protein [Shinella zoogloeoides]